MINLCAWSACHCGRGNAAADGLHVESTGIFRIGRSDGCRWVLDARVLGLPQPPKPDDCHLVKINEENKDRTLDEEMSQDTMYNTRVERVEDGRGRGYPPTAYYPRNEGCERWRHKKEDDDGHVHYATEPAQ